MNGGGSTRGVAVLAVASAIGACTGLAADGLPGAPPFPVELQRRISSALTARRPGEPPRTRHRAADGSPKYTNRLILETSPYLQQHAHNPVNWYPWGEEALAAARTLDRPILLSIGYSTCHWCHVMEEESFEDEEIAALLNAHYVAIKVDREERPDLDAVYMAAVQALSGRGGWPMTTWLTPEGQPFFGGTYFPARDGERGTRRGFLTLLREMHGLYANDREALVARAAELARQVREELTLAAAGSEIPGREVLDAAFQRSARAYDETWGGLRGAPKFPSSLPVRLLLRQHHRTADATALRMATHTLTRMAAGGIHDQLGGGFHRYTVDERWLVPHFEKMLYDNALLAVAYVEAWQATGNEEFARVARSTLRYLALEMSAPEGGFWSATDADSPAPNGELEEGRFFTWTPTEIRAALASEGARIVESVYGVTATGQLDGRSVLHLARTPGPDAAALEATREVLVRARARRPPPRLDDKILTAWNGLAISAFARAGFAFDDAALLGRAEAAASFVLGRLRVDGRLRRSFRERASLQPGFLDDYAFLIGGLLDLYESTGHAEWLGEALTLQATLERWHRDDAAGGYFMTAHDHETLLAREKPATDGAEPSGNSVALTNLLRLAELTGRDGYRQEADRVLRVFAGALRERPGSLGELLLGLDLRLGEPLEVAVVTGSTAGAAAPLLDVLRRKFLPHKVVVVVEGPSAETESLVPWLRGKRARDGKPTAYVCQQGLCRLPATDPRTFAAQLAGPAADR